MSVKMTDREVLDELQKETPLNLARREFSSWRAKIEQAGQQRKPLDPIELRRMEFEAVKSILARYESLKIEQVFVDDGNEFKEL
jgi:hypothetical protein